MAYIAQLLPDLEQARIIRDALAEYIRSELITEDQVDTAWSILANLTTQMQRARSAERFPSERP